jgi:thiol:disulfide interchange protein DsbC
MKSLPPLFAALLCVPAFAADDTALAQVRSQLAQTYQVKPEDVQRSPVAGLYEVRQGHDYVYVTADGKYLLQGDVIDLKTGEHLTENRRRADRLAALAQLGNANTIEFAPLPPARPDYVVTVFTDVDCAYCRQLHSQIKEYNAKGIAIRYASFPRSGLDTPSYYKAEAVWCAADRKAALTKAKLGDKVPLVACDNPVAREYQLGYELGVRGTPSMVLPSGELVEGYVPPAALAAHLAGKDKGEAPSGLAGLLE